MNLPRPPEGPARALLQGSRAWRWALAVGIAVAIEQGLVVPNIKDADRLSMRELAEAVGTATGRPALLDADTSSLADSFTLLADVTRLRGLGFAPRVTLAEGLTGLADLLGPFPEIPSARAVFRREPPARRRMTLTAAVGAGEEARTC